MLLVVNVSNANIYRTGCFWKRREIYDETLFWLYAMLKFYDRVIFVQKITRACVGALYWEWSWSIMLLFHGSFCVSTLTWTSLRKNRNHPRFSSSKNSIYLATNKFNIVNKLSNIGSSSTQLYRAIIILISSSSTYPLKISKILNNTSSNHHHHPEMLGPVWSSHWCTRIRLIVFNLFVEKLEDKRRVSRKSSLPGFSSS